MEWLTLKLLFVTHVFLWWVSEPEKLSRDILALCEDHKNELLLSVVSVWELQIKLQLGKLKLEIPLLSLVEIQQESNNLSILDLRFDHIFALQDLPHHHKDPFDRLLISQAIYENALLCSIDKNFS